MQPWLSIPQLLEFVIVDGFDKNGFGFAECGKSVGVKPAFLVQAEPYGRGGDHDKSGYKRCSTQKVVDRFTFVDCVKIKIVDEQPATPIARKIAQKSLNTATEGEPGFHGIPTATNDAAR